MNNYPSWGRYPSALNQQVIDLGDNSTIKQSSGYCLPRGMGRSYGDVCLNSDGYLLLTERLNEVIHFDQQSGLIRCQSGVTLDSLIRVALPKGWFLPVTPGTKFVTVGGAVANDVHGKNSHRVGAFGNHLVGFELWRSNGESLYCSRDCNVGFFHATIGGLGLTGAIAWVELQLKPLSGPYLETERINTQNFEELYDVLTNQDSPYEYAVSWIDCFARGDAFGRGFVSFGNHITRPEPEPNLLTHNAESAKPMPVFLPSLLLNPFTMRLFNQLQYHKQIKKVAKKIQHYNPFFYPLDAASNWNLLYGKRGFQEWQCMIPKGEDKEVAKSILFTVAQWGPPPYLAGMKNLGGVEPEGMLSFAHSGITLAMDFPNTGERLQALFDRLNAMVKEAGGRLYPAKDAQMPSELFLQSYPRFEEFYQYRDKQFASNFFRRVTASYRQRSKQGDVLDEATDTI